MANDSFNIVPGMSAWVDMNKKYKNAYFRKLEAEKKKEVVDEPLPEMEEIEVEEAPIEIPEICNCDDRCECECDDRCECECECECDSDNELNICPVCGIDMPEDKKFCSKECFYKRGTIKS
jgi:hypothetical protein